MRRFSVTLAVVIPLAACSDVAEKSSELPFDALEAGKSDSIALAGALTFTTPVSGQLDKSIPRATYTLEVRPGAKVDLEVTHKGTSAALDTIMTVVGPTAADVASTPLVGRDDDSGWGFHSKLKGLTLAAGGRYLVTVSTYNGKQKGKYTLVATCKSGDCAPLPIGPIAPPFDDRYCHPQLLTGMNVCIDEQMADPDRNPVTMDALEVARACADAEPVAPAHDAICATETPAPSWCALSYEEFWNSAASLCVDPAVAYARGRECVFGGSWHDLKQGPVGVYITHARVVTSVAGLSATEQAQLVAAVNVSAAEVTTPTEALDAVDESAVNIVDLWDATHHRAFTGYEYGAGDNSYGAIFEHGTTTIAARIQDSDFYACAVPPGPELALCAVNADCAEGLTCFAINEGRGRCASNRTTTGDFGPCTASVGCGATSGLLCKTTDPSGAGFCQPASMAGRFDDFAVVRIPPSGAVERTITAFGLTTVSTDVQAKLVVDHERPQDLKITLTNPAGTVGVVWDHESGQETGAFDLERAVRAFPGDESANGAWLLRIENTGSALGTLVSWRLEIQSRWD